jgi:hypothetical protein
MGNRRPETLFSFEMLLCVLAMYKGYQRVRSIGIGHQVLQDILIRDSVIYYLS